MSAVLTYGCYGLILGGVIAYGVHCHLCERREHRARAGPTPHVRRSGPRRSPLKTRPQSCRLPGARTIEGDSMTEANHSSGSSEVSSRVVELPFGAQPSKSSVVLSEQQRAYIDGLRALANLLEAHPRASNHHESHRHLIFVNGHDALVALVRELGGRWDKDAIGADDHYFGMARDLGGGVSVYVYASRKVVCERVVLGTRTVQRPAPDAPTIDVEEEVVEWRCPESLLAAAEPPRLSNGLMEGALDLTRTDEPKDDE